MDENMSIEFLNNLIRSFDWTNSNGLSIEHTLDSAILNQQIQEHLRLLSQQAQTLPVQLPPLAPSSPNVSLCAPSTPSSTSSSPLSLPHHAHQVASTPLASPIRNNDTSRSVSMTGKTYSDCEKKHFLDVAYENSWGTTVAANKFTRVWGKGPTRRMFYWWREQFKKEYDREQKVLEVLRERKTELTSELIELNCDDKLSSERVQALLQQIGAVDLEISNLAQKKQKLFCTITGDVCVHGDGLQEETATNKKLSNPFACEYCKMPFQKETTCFVHMRLCQTRFVVCTEKNEPAVPTSDSGPTLLSMDVLRDNNGNTELRDLAEKLIAGLAACSSTTESCSNDV